MEKIHKLVIIGSGPAGLTAGIYAGRAQLKPLIIRGEKPGGQLMSTSAVENWPGNISIMGPELMINMQNHAEASGASYLDETVVKVDFTSRPFKLWTTHNTEIISQSVIIATGAAPVRLNVPGESEYWGKGVSSCAVCDGMFYRNKSVVIVGGGDSAAEMASFLARVTDKITIVQILDKLSASKASQEKILHNSNITIIYNSTVEQIAGNGNHITNITIRNTTTKVESVLQADGLFLAIGYKPKTELFKGQIDLDEHGYLQLSDHTKTSISGIFGAGDVADYRYRQAITSSGHGCMAALDAEKYLEKIE